MRNRANHYQITIDGIDISYLYIRKNACTSWKQVFVNESQYQFESDTNPITFMRKYHYVSPQKAKLSKYRIVVIREPLERVVSAYLNQFVTRLNRKTEFHEKVEKYLACKSEQVTFRRFVNDYVMEAGSKDLDSHLWSQKSHLSNINYNKIIKLEDLHKDTSELFGETFANKYFKKKLNATSKLRRYATEAADLTAQEIIDSQKAKMGLPSVDSFLNDKDIHSTLEEAYRGDVELYANHFVKRVCVVLNGSFESVFFENELDKFSNIEAVVTVFIIDGINMSRWDSLHSKGGVKVIPINKDIKSKILFNLSASVRLANSLIKENPSKIYVYNKAALPSSWLTSKLLRADLSFR
ncbi:sulfotransferase family 2 domain-containing protein [Kangiella shandongensis]|uniref:sulfotransferase family 2 domain-containing protein n=1 Tax=Kangiella shandongensis TaxID=2763258 RepID=UPI001CBEBB94|nr:sulfotransferase family 2 domain-containing protein [Kangiella shandongensis]